MQARRYGSYVLTNNGAAIVAVDPSGPGCVDWAFTCPTEAPQTQQRFFYNEQMEAPPIPPAAMLVAHGALFFKEHGSDTMYALDPSGPSLKWKRPIDDTVTLAQASGNDLYFIGTELDCIDIETKVMQWSTKLSTATGSIRPVLSGDRIYIFGQRGIHDVQLADGDTGPMFRGFDRESAGGALWQTPDRLVTVSSLAVTAYPLSPATGNSKP